MKFNKVTTSIFLITSINCFAGTNLGIFNDLGPNPNGGGNFLLCLVNSSGKQPASILEPNAFTELEPGSGATYAVVTGNCPKNIPSSAPFVSVMNLNGTIQGVNIFNTPQLRWVNQGTCNANGLIGCYNVNWGIEKR